MLVGLPLLTLVPGISGGSETYARELCRALARVGDARVRGARPDARARRRRRAADRRRRRSTRPRRRRQAGSVRWDGARLRPGALRRQLERADVVHYPLTVPVPPARRARPSLTPPRRPAPRPAGALPARRAAVPSARLRPRRARRRTGDRDQRVGPGAGRRAARPRSRARVTRSTSGSTTSASRPTPASRASRFLLYPARPWPHKNHARLFEAFARVRAERPELRLVLTGVGHDPASCRTGSRRAAASRGRARRRSTAAPPRSSSRASTRASGCLRSRRWPAAARSPRPTPGRCRRCAATRRSSSTRASRRRSPPVSTEALDRSDELRATRARPGGRVSPGTRPRAPTTASTRRRSPRLKPRASSASTSSARARRSRPPAPTRALACLRRVADEIVELRRAAMQRRVAAHVVAPVEARRARTRTRRAPRPSASRPSRRRSRPARRAAASATSPGRSRRHSPSRGARIEIAEHELALQPERDRRRCARHLAGQEVERPSRRLVVVEDPAAA